MKTSDPIEMVSPGKSNHIAISINPDPIEAVKPSTFVPGIDGGSEIEVKAGMKRLHKIANGVV